MHFQDAKQTFAIMLAIGPLLLPPLFPAHAQHPAPPVPHRGLRYEIDQQGALPLWPEAQPQVQSDNEAYSPACASWSRMAFASYRDHDWEVYVSNFTGTNQVRLTYRSNPDTAPKYNRGCTRIVYQAYQNSQYDVWVMNANGANKTNLTNHPANDGIPCWSPDSSRVAFQSDRDGNNEIYVMNADGSGQTNLTNHSAYDGMPAWSLDGSRIAFVSNRTGQYEVWVMAADGTGPTQVTHGAQWAEYPSWSPGGARIAFSNDDNGDGFMDVDIVNVDGTGLITFAGHTTNVDDWYPSWSPDGEWIAYGRTNLIEYQGQWYWTQSIIGVKEAPPWTTYEMTWIYSGYDWRPHWETTDAPPPTSQVCSLPAYSQVWNVLVKWSGTAGGAAPILNYNVQYRDGKNGAWTDWLNGTTGTSASFNGTAGHTYYFRSRARDRSYVESWPGGDGDTHTTLYSYMLTGRVHDNRGAPIPGLAIGISPQPLADAISGVDGTYATHLIATGVHTITVNKNGYGTLPPAWPDLQDDLNQDLVLPPADNVIRNWGFESGSLGPDWIAGGYPLPAMTDEVRHTGHYAARLGYPAADASSGTHPDEPTSTQQASDSFITQVVTIPITMHRPTLSVLYWFETAGPGEGDSWLEARVDDGVTVTQHIFPILSTPQWTADWMDMSDWLGQTITLTLDVHRQDSAPATWAYLDEVSLGSAHANLWVNKSSSTAPPGGPVRYAITYGNLGVIPAQTVRLTDTLPAGVSFVSASPPPSSTAPLVWSVGDLAAGAGPFSIVVTATVDAGTPVWTTLTNTVTIGAATPEADRDNNTAVAQTFVGYRVYLPLTLKSW